MISVKIASFSKKILSEAEGKGGRTLSFVMHISLRPRKHFSTCFTVNKQKIYQKINFYMIS